MESVIEDDDISHVVLLLLYVTLSLLLGANTPVNSHNISKKNTYIHHLHSFTENISKANPTLPIAK